MHALVKMLAPLRRHAALALLLLAALGAPLHAQSGGNDGQNDPPSRVARLSYLAGDLGLLPADAKDWSDASVNRPLTSGDRLSSGRDARAELELGGGTLRIAARTDIGVLDLSDRIAQIELTQGTLGLTVRRLDPGQSYEIDTPTVALVVDRPGSFRVDVQDNGRSTLVSDFDGSAIVYGEHGAQREVLGGRRYRFDDSSLSAVAISDIEGGDAFDAWSAERDRRYAYLRSASRRYVSDDVVGYQDLDQYGDWRSTGAYGEVWFPAHVDAGWAPYRDGHWAYIAPWGWTWVDNSPWGFAPYHYGRWAYIDGGWGWIPGPLGVRPIYAPALVAFVGGGGWSVGISSGPVGWFPLGPGEIYNPWYRCNREYYTRVNVTNIQVTRITNTTTIINNINNHYGRYRDNLPVRAERYVNRDAPHGFSAIPAQAFAGGRSVQHDLLKVNQRRLAEATVLPRGANLRPTAGAIAPPRSAHAAALPSPDFRREVVARHVPPLPPAEQRFGPAGNFGGAARPLQPVAHVRLLNDRAGSEFAARPVPGRPLPADAHVRSLLPPPAAVESARGRAMPALPGELRSARFAHPQDTPMPGRYGAAEPGRPLRGQSADRAPQQLPQVPQIERATPIQPLPPNAVQRNQRFEAARPLRDSLPAEPLYGRMPAQRFEQPASQAPRAQLREPPRPMPQPLRQEYQPPRYQPPPRPVPAFVPPPPRAMAPPPRAAPEPHPRPPKKDERQH